MTVDTSMTDYQSRILDALTAITESAPVTTEEIRLYLTVQYGYTTGVKVGNTLAQLRDRFGVVEGRNGLWKPAYANR